MKAAVRRTRILLWHTVFPCGAAVGFHGVLCSRQIPRVSLVSSIKNAKEEMGREVPWQSSRESPMAYSWPSNGSPWRFHVSPQGCGGSGFHVAVPRQPNGDSASVHAHCHGKNTHRLYASMAEYQPCWQQFFEESDRRGSERVALFGRRSENHTSPPAPAFGIMILTSTRFHPDVSRPSWNWIFGALHAHLRWPYPQDSHGSFHGSSMSHH